MKDFSETLANQIKTRREALPQKMTRSDLGILMGYSSGSIVSDWESGNKKPSIGVLLKLSELFECSVDELLLGNQSKYVEADNSEISKLKDKYTNTLEELNTVKDKYMNLQDKYTRLIEELKKI